MTETWLSTDWQQAGLVVLSAVAIFTMVIAVARVVGLRAFSKMSSFDFAVTVATGSVMASVAASSTSLANGAIALVTLYSCQWVVARLRRRTGAVGRAVDNRPLALLIDGQIITEHLTRARVTRGDVVAKLREANVLRLEDVRAVVLETTGDVNVLHGDGPVDDELLRDVEGFEARDRIESRRAAPPSGPEDGTSP